VGTQPRGPKERAAEYLSPEWIERLDRMAFRARQARLGAVRRGFGALGYNVARRSDYYSPLPVLEEIRETRSRWDRPSELVGLDVDVDAMAAQLGKLAEAWEDDFLDTTGEYDVNVRRGFGPGYPAFDARTLYYMLREHKPARYVEVGSGLSTYYASLAAARNAADGAPLALTCVEPYPFDALRTIDGIDLVQAFVQDVPLETFGQLGDGDVLFIDSTHALKIDSDVAYLFLEVLPRLAKGVIVHIHDIPLPWNVPFPTDTWLFGERWPMYWNEPMVVQLFLAFNSAFEIVLSTPLLRHHDERLLAERFGDYVPVADDPNPPSSLWLRRVG
jgi:hypothetical protein